MNRILVVEDDHKVQKALQRLFEPEGFTVEIAPDGASGLEAFKRESPTAVILDLNLPKLSGRDICREIQQINSSVPVVILSAASDVVDKVLLLELGAHDYVTKPFSPRELLARVRAAIRAAARPGKAAAQEASFTFGDVLIEFDKMEVTRAGTSVQLTAQEFKMARFLIENKERALSREELLNEVWGYQNYPSTRTVDNHMLRLRQKLERDPANPVHFRTIHGTGYKFVP